MPMGGIESPEGGRTNSNLQYLGTAAWNEKAVTGAEFKFEEVAKMRVA